ncbi:hypothetical protein [Halorubrum halodurans]|nr:hypothetical protein [Halorubrum halodurans]
MALALVGYHGPETLSAAAARGPTGAADEPERGPTGAAGSTPGTSET